MVSTATQCDFGIPLCIFHFGLLLLSINCLIISTLASCVRGLECGGMNNNGQREALKIKSMEFFQCLKMPGGVGKDQ